MLLADTVETLQRNQSRELTYLDAGCGTGEQTLGVARTWPELRVTGLDLNRASLDLAEALARRKGIDATFEYGSLMEPLSGLGPFDLITSIGVLHHLPDPAQGFRTLRQAAHDHTMFMGMVYGRYGRWDLIQMRDALSLIAGEETPRSERLAILRESPIARNAGPSYYFETLMKRARFGPWIKPLEAARRVFAGRNAAYQADAYTHVQEVTYTWGELIDVLGDSGWRFVGWPKKSGMPDDPAQLFRGEARRRVTKMSVREQAAVYEKIVRPSNLYFLAQPA
jgi:SAM-dependent methyltransferase